ncbi:polysaccharide biosynthesis/export family protein [Sphingomonas gilva]|nr:polysaccharide biosynthesis/export family protein [Sphingomonas gilva]
MAIAAVALGGCSYSGKRADIAYAPSTFTAPDSQFAMVDEDAYRIGPQDIVKVTVFEVPEVSGDFEVNALGKIDMPLVGGVTAQNLTTTELAAALEKSLGAKYFQNPDVTVALKEVRSQRVTVDGSINAPGIYPVAGNLTLLQAVAMAKGVSEDANPERVVVFRTIDGRRAAAAFDLTAIREGLSPDPEIYGNDIVVVAGSRSKAAFRDVLQSLPVLSIFRFF